MELVTPRKYSELAAEKIAKELTEFKGNNYGNAVKSFVASTLMNFCEQNERFARVVYETEATLSDCCAKIMQKCGNHISDIDVYRGAVKYYFPNAEIEFTMTIDASGDAPTPEQMAKPDKKLQKEEGNSDQPANVATEKPKAAKRERKKPAIPEKKKPAEPPKAALEDKPAPKPKREPRRKVKQESLDDDLIQLTLF